MPRRQIMLTCFNKGPKVEESKITGTKSKLYFYRPKPEFANITKTKKILTLKTITTFVPKIMCFFFFSFPERNGVLIIMD